MKNRCKLQFHLVKQLQMLILLLSIVLGVTASAAGNSSGLDSFCGFTAGEMRKDGRIGNLEQIETKAKKRFRKFERVGLKYSKKGRLCEICSMEKVQGSKPAAAKKEFKECVKWFEKSGLSKEMIGDGEWDDAKGGRWTGWGEVDTEQGGLKVHAEVRAGYDDPKLRNKKDKMTGWLVYVFITWSDVDNPSPRRVENGNAAKKVQKSVKTTHVSPHSTISVNVKKYDPTSGISRREFIEQTFGVKFGEGLTEFLKIKPDESYSIFRHLDKPLCGMEEAQFEKLDKLSRITLYPPSKKIASFVWEIPMEYYKEPDCNVAKDKAKDGVSRLSKLVEGWLGINPPKIKEGVSQLMRDGVGKVEEVAFSAEYRELIPDAKGIGTMKATVVSTVTKLPNGVHELYPAHIRITYEFKTDVKASEVVASMKRCSLPVVSFGPDETLADALKFFRKASIDLQSAKQEPKIILFCGRDSKMEDERVFGHLYKRENISFFDALLEVCSLFDLELSVPNGNVVIQSSANKAR